MRWLARAAAFFGVLCATSVLGAATNYTFTTIDVPGLTKVQATGVNNAGQIVDTDWAVAAHMRRFSTVAASSLPFPCRDPLEHKRSVSSNSGQIVGSFSDSNGTHAFLDNGGSFTTISVPGSQCCEQANGINNAGQIVGYFQSNPSTSGYGNGSFLYSAGSVTTIVSPGDFATEAFGINNGGQTVGGISNPRVGSHPFVYQGGVFTAINPPCCGDSFAAAINNAGQILVNANASFLYDNGVYGDAIVFPGAQKTVASAINDSGAIAGYYVDSSSVTHGFFATPLPVSNPTAAISIDFVGTGTPMAATETAGVAARANWNAANGASSSAAWLCRMRTAPRRAQQSSGTPTIPGAPRSPIRQATIG